MQIVAGFSPVDRGTRAAGLVLISRADTRENQVRLDGRIIGAGGLRDDQSILQLNFA